MQHEVEGVQRQRHRARLVATRPVAVTDRRPSTSRSRHDGVRRQHDHVRAAASRRGRSRPARRRWPRSTGTPGGPRLGAEVPGGQRRRARPCQPRRAGSARRSARRQSPAPAPQDEPAEHRDVVVRRDRLVAARAVAAPVATTDSPLRHAVDDHVEERADDQAEDGAPERRGARRHGRNASRSSSDTCQYCGFSSPVVCAAPRRVGPLREVRRRRVLQARVVAVVLAGSRCRSRRPCRRCHATSGRWNRGR